MIRKLGLLFAMLAMLFVAVPVMAEEVAAEVAVEASPWASVGGSVLGLVLDVLAPILAAVASLAFWKLMKKWGIEKDEAMDRKVQSVIQNGIGYAERWAKTQADKPIGNAKKAEAVKFIVEQLDNEALKMYSRDKLEKLIEARLGIDIDMAKLPEATPVNGG